MAYPEGTYIDGDKIVAGGTAGECPMWAVWTLDGKQYSVQVQLIVSEPQVSVYEGPYTVSPQKTAVVLNTQNKLLTDDVDVLAIQLRKTQNAAGGNTVNIG